MKKKIILINMLIFYFMMSAFSAEKNISVQTIIKKYDLEFQHDGLTGEVILSNSLYQIKLFPNVDIIEINQIQYDMPSKTFQSEYDWLVDEKILFYMNEIQQKQSRYMSVLDVSSNTQEKPTVTYQTKMKVVLDAGHGGKDTGTIGQSGSREKDVALKMVKYVKEALEEKGVMVVLTRSTDAFIPLPERPVIASEQNADAFVSIHLNAASDRKVDGMEVFVYRYRDQKYEENRASTSLQIVNYKKSLLLDDADICMGAEDTLMRLQMLKNVEKSRDLGDSILKSMLVGEKVNNRGVKEANFSVLRNSTCPSVLVEMGFLSNSVSEKNFLNAHYCKNLADKIARGIINYHR